MTNSKWIKNGTSIFLVIVALVTIYFSFISFKETNLALHPDRLEMEGIYQMEIPKHEIISIQILSSIPAISRRTNGFNGGSYRKGSFVLKDSSRVKLYINQKAKQFIRIETADTKIYYNRADQSIDSIFQKINTWKATE